jgi:hypothetical protein
VNPDTIAAINRQDREVEVAGNDMREALERIVAGGGRVEASERTKHNGIWKLEIFYADNANGGY